MKLFEILAEALKPSQYRPFVKNWDREKYKDLFKKYTDDPKAYRIYLPIHAEKREVHAPHDIIEAVREAGYEIEDYLAGIASKDDGKRKIKIGKLLKDPKLQQMFANDPHRAASKKVEYYAVISRHPYDIAGMSTNRGWKSCMNLHDGMNKHYVPLDVQHGSLIAYVIKADDKNIENPVGRVLIKPFHDLTMKHGDNAALGVEDRIYGTDVPGFRQTVIKWADEVNESKNLNGLFLLHPALYPDSGEASRSRLIGKDHSEAVKIAHNPSLIANIDNPSEELIRAAVKVPPGDGELAHYHHGFENLRYIKHIPERLIHEFVKRGGPRVLMKMHCPIDQQIILQYFPKDPMLIQKIEHPSHEIMKQAIDKFARTSQGYGIQYINNLPPDLVMYALEKNIDFLYYLPDDHKALQKVHDYFIKHYARTHPWNSTHLKKLSAESLEKLLEIDPNTLTYVQWDTVSKSKRVKNLIERAIEKKPSLIKDLPKSLISKETIMAGIKKSPHLLLYMTPKIQREVVTADPELIRHINTRGQSHMSKIATELAWVAIKHNPLLIKYVELPTKEMAEYAILKNEDAIYNVGARFWTVHAVATALHRKPKKKDYVVEKLKRSRFYSWMWPDIEDELEHLNDLGKEDEAK